MMGRVLHILSGGAAQGLVRQLQPAFEAAHDCKLEATFGAVGLMKDRLLAGAPCDLLILSAALVRELAQAGRVQPASVRDLGAVQTGIALKEGAPPAPLANADDLRRLLEAADGIYFPDPAKATAGIHFMKVLQALGVAAARPEHLHTFPNGATAMAALAQAPGARAVGCTQVTEILITPGVQLAGLLPAPHALATMYTAGVCTGAAEPALASQLIDALSAPAAAATRQHCGFET